jgi:membrane-bound inhibitor of C-type lysozyme
MHFKSIYLFGICLPLLTACQSVSVPNLFDNRVKELSRIPEDAIRYQCDTNQQFHVRMLNKGSDAWLILTDHEVNLSQSTSNPNRYTSGAIALEINGDQTTLSDGDKLAYLNCKAQKPL